MEYHTRPNVMQCQGLLDMTFQTFFLFSFSFYFFQLSNISSNMTTSHEYQNAQAKKRPALCLSGHTFLNHRVLSVFNKFNKFVFAIFVFGPLHAWFAAIDTVDTWTHSMCSHRNLVTNRPEDQTRLLPDFDHVPGTVLDSGSSLVICFPWPRGKKPGSSPWVYLCSGCCFSQR